MSNNVQFNVTAGPMKGKTFSFEEHDTFIFGREHRFDSCKDVFPSGGKDESNLAASDRKATPASV